MSGYRRHGTGRSRRTAAAAATGRDSADYRRLVGIGRELARLFAGDGAELVLIARSEGQLRELAASSPRKYECRRVGAR